MFKKQSSFTEISARFLVAAHTIVAAESRVKTLFTLGGEGVIAEDFFSPSGLMPAFVWLADKLHVEVAGYSFGFGFQRDEKALAGYKVNLSIGTEANSEVLMYLMESFDQCRKIMPRDENIQGATAIDSLIKSFTEDLNNKFSSSPTPVPVSTVAHIM